MGLAWVSLQGERTLVRKTVSANPDRCHGGVLN